MHSAPDFEAKICAPDKLRERLRDIARPLVFTNGVFDILHRGSKVRPAGIARLTWF